MALALPFVGAAAGYAIGGTLTSVSIGWMVGSWMMNATQGQKNQIFDPGAEEMPSINQALRGATMPITFGTNRISSHLVWQKNFTTIRNEGGGGGGGKAGGSGMGSKGGGADSAQVSYEYKWDLLYHLGMSCDPVNLFGGWLGAERLNSETILAIISGTASSNLSFGPTEDRPENASLTFEEAFWHGASSTADTAATNWSHFQTEEGQPFRFPSTYYVGFKQLNLGGRAAVPQVSWEVGPGYNDINYNSNYYGSLDYIATDIPGFAGGTLITGDDGLRYVIVPSESSLFVCQIYRINFTTGTVTLVDNISDTEFDSDATSVGLDPGTSYDFGQTVRGGWGIPGTNYFIGWGFQTGSGSRSNHAIVLYKINASGAREALGGYAARANTITGKSGLLVFTDVYSVGSAGSDPENSPIVLFGLGIYGAVREPLFIALPSPASMNGSAIVVDDTNNRFMDCIESIQSITAKNFGAHISYRPFQTWGWFIPLGTETRFVYYIGPSDIKWADDNIGNVGGCTYIEGKSSPVMEAIDFTVSHSSGIASWTAPSAPTDVGSEFVSYNGDVSEFPFSDAVKDLDGTTNYEADYYPSPYFARLESLSASSGLDIYICLFTKIYTDQADSPTGSFVKVVGYIYNPALSALNQPTFRNIGTISGSPWDTVNDLGASAGNRYSYIPYDHRVLYDEPTSTLVMGAFYSSVHPALNKVHFGEFGDLTFGGQVQDVLPPYVIRKVLTSDLFGIGVSESVIDETSYQAAMSYCENEGMWISVQYRREQSALNVINELLSIYGGYLIDSGGKVKFGLTEHEATPVRTIDNDRLLSDGQAPVNVTRGARQDTYNKVKVNYFDRSLDYRQNFVEVADEVDMDLNGTRAIEYPATFVMTEATANKIAIRGLWSNLYARDVYDFKLGPKDADLEPGDVITLVDSFHPSLSSGKQVRLTHWAERAPMEFSVQAVDDIQYVSEADFAALSQTQAGSSSLYGPSLPPASFTMYELPKEFQGANGNLYVGYRQQSPTMGALLYTSADGVSYSMISNQQPYIISGIIGGPLPTRDPGYFEENVEVYLMPDTATGNWSASSMTWAQTFALDDVSATGRALGTGLMWINSEMMAFQGANLLGQNHYRFDYLYRGWGGTHIQAHASGDTFHKHGGGIFRIPINEDKIGTVIYYKVAPYNFAGNPYNISSIDARTYQIQGTYFRPQNPSIIQTYINSPGSYLTIQSEDLISISKKKVITGGSDVQFEWYDSSRVSGYGAQGYGTGDYGRFEQDNPAPEFMVQVLSSDNSTVVRCTTVSTTAFVYGVDANSTDFNGWNGDFVLNVTPFNQFGTSLRTQTKVLELFE